MPPNTNRGPSVGGAWIRLGGRTLAGGSCRDEVVAAIHTLEVGSGAQIFTVRDVYTEMAASGTRYAQSTVFKTIQRMKAPPQRLPMIQLERVGGKGFRIAEAAIGGQRPTYLQR